MTVDEILDHVITEPNTGCWIWDGLWDRHGYGVVMVDKKRRAAYRFVYQTLVGEIERGLHLDHVCRVKCCVNPDHLEPVTPKENYRRRRERGKSAQFVDVVDFPSTLRESCDRHMDRISDEMRSIRGVWRDYDTTTLLQLLHTLETIRLSSFRTTQLAEVYADQINGEDGRVTPDEARETLRNMAKLMGVRW